MPENTLVATPKIGLLIPEFPGQTHVAWWRVGSAIRKQGVEVQMLSTRRPDADSECAHSFLIDEGKSTFYSWPPKILGVVRSIVSFPKGWWAAINYLTQLEESSALEKIKLIPVLISAANLAQFSRESNIDHIFTHTCANGAHLVAMSYLLGGPSYSLRLGGDLEVYGKDHRSKMKHASFVASSSDKYLEQLTNQVEVSPDRLFWTWVGVDTDIFFPSASSTYQVSDLPHIVTVSRLDEAKGHKYILEALAILRDGGLRFRYSIAGSGSFKTEIEENISRLNLNEEVTLVGSLSQDKVIRLLQEADVFVLASINKGEAAPAVICEAMACAVPSVCTIIGSTDRMIEHEVDGLLVSQKDAQAIADALLKLIENPDFYKKVAAAALEKSTIFDCSAVAKKLLERIYP